MGLRVFRNGRTAIGLVRSWLVLSLTHLGRFTEAAEYEVALQLDPVEKKPFFHTYPGSRALSFGMHAEHRTEQNRDDLNPRELE